MRRFYTRLLLILVFLMTPFSPSMALPIITPATYDNNAYTFQGAGYSRLTLDSPDLAYYGIYMHMVEQGVTSEKVSRLFVKYTAPGVPSLKELWGRIQQVMQEAAKTNTKDPVKAESKVLIDTPDLMMVEVTINKVPTLIGIAKGAEGSYLMIHDVLSPTKPERAADASSPKWQAIVKDELTKIARDTTKSAPETWVPGLFITPYFSAEQAYNAKDFSVTLLRSACIGDCAPYRLTFFSNGLVNIRDDIMPFGVAKSAKASRSRDFMIPPEKVKMVMDALKAINFLNLPDKPLGDTRTVAVMAIMLEADNKIKTVYDVSFKDDEYYKALETLGKLLDVIGQTDCFLKNSCPDMVPASQ